MNGRFFFGFGLLLLPFFLHAETDSEIQPYIRLGGSVVYPTLDVAVRQLCSPDSNRPDVWLVGAVHIGERAYYQEIQRFLNLRERVLFECASKPAFESLPCVTDADRSARTLSRMRSLAELASLHQQRMVFLPRSLPELRRNLIRLRESIQTTFIPALVRDDNGNEIHYAVKDSMMMFEGRGGVSWSVSANDSTLSHDLFPLQYKLARALGLSFQLREIRYDRPNFEHCDLSLSEIRHLMRDSQPAGLAALERFDAFFLTGGAGILDALLGGLYQNPSWVPRVRYLLMTILVRVDAARAVPEDLELALLTYRNQAVLDRIHSFSRKEVKEAAVFYGAAHLSGIERALRNEGYRPGDNYWISAMAVDLNAEGIDPDDLKLPDLSRFIP